MIDLANKCVFVRTQEEYENLLRMAKLQGFKLTDDFKVAIALPNILFFNRNKIIAKLNSDEARTIYEASEILNANTEKEMTAREFIKYITDIHNCSERKCSKCVLNASNTKCNKSLCDIHRWGNNIDELLEIVKSGKFTVSTPEEKAIDTIENFIENPYYSTLNDDFVDALKLAVEKMKEVK